MTIPTIDFTGVETGDTGHTFTIPDQVVGDYVLFEPGGVPHPKTVYPVDLVEAVYIGQNGAIGSCWLLLSDAITWYFSGPSGWTREVAWQVVHGVQRAFHANNLYSDLIDEKYTPNLNYMEHPALVVYSAEWYADSTLASGDIATATQVITPRLYEPDGGGYEYAGGLGVWSNTTDGPHVNPERFALDVAASVGRLFTSTVWAFTGDGPGGGTLRPGPGAGSGRIGI